MNSRAPIDSSLRDSRFPTPALIAALTGAALLALAGLGASPAAADIVVTNTGGRVVGDIIEETDAYVKVKTAAGVTTIERDDIESIDRGSSPQKMFDRRFKAVKKDDVAGYRELISWCNERGLEEQAETCHRKIIEIDPEDTLARSALGYQKVDGQWYQGDDIWVARGFVKHDGRWITREDKNRIDQGLIYVDGRWMSKEKAEAYRAERAPRPVARRERPARDKGGDDDGEDEGGEEKPTVRREKPKRDIELPEDDKALVNAARGRDQEKRLAALAEIKRRGAPLTEALAEKIDKEVEKLEKDIAGYFKSNKDRLRGALGGLMKERRKVALATIFDKSKYPDENHGAAGQPEVDRVVNEVKRIWEDPYAELVEQASTVKDKMAELDQILKEREEYAGGPSAAAEKKAVEDRVRAEVNEAYNMKRFPIDAADRQVMEQSISILKYNESVPTSVNPEERACIDATNEYRMMLGKKALKIFEPLVRAARGHSEEMKRLNYFSHNSPVPENSDPGKRAKKQGATFTGENIAMGQRSGVQAFQAWYTSSGHHRNILGNHNSIGLGQDQHYWTQLFGADNPK